jgi:hypothetical protein
MMEVEDVWTSGGCFVYSHSLTIGTDYLMEDAVGTKTTVENGCTNLLRRSAHPLKIVRVFSLMMDACSSSCYYVCASVFISFT